MFQRTETGIRNIWSREYIDITDLTYLASGASKPMPEGPMTLSARLIQDDLAIMYEKPDGQYYLLAGAILLAGFWRLEDKFGMPLSEIHTSGDVAGYRDKLQKGMENFFRHLKCESPVLRNNYSVQMDGELEWSSSLGRKDEWTGKVGGWKKGDVEGKVVESFHFRSERQSLRR